MFVNNEITNRGLLHKLLRKAAAEVTMDERTIWARAVENTIKDASRPSTPFRYRLATSCSRDRSFAGALRRLRRAARRARRGLP